MKKKTKAGDPPGNGKGRLAAAHPELAKLALE